jgi:hypothetical protein
MAPAAAAAAPASPRLAPSSPRLLRTGSGSGFGGGFGGTAVWANTPPSPRGESRMQALSDGAMESPVGLGGPEPQWRRRSVMPNTVRAPVYVSAPRSRQKEREGAVTHPALHSVLPRAFRAVVRFPASVVAASAFVVCRDVCVRACVVVRVVVCVEVITLTALFWCLLQRIVRIECGWRRCSRRDAADSRDEAGGHGGAEAHRSQGSRRRGQQSAWPRVPPQGPPPLSLPLPLPCPGAGAAATCRDAVTPQQTRVVATVSARADACAVVYLRGCCVVRCRVSLCTARSLSLCRACAVGYCIFLVLCVTVVDRTCRVCRAVVRCCV